MRNSSTQRSSINEQNIVTTFMLKLNEMCIKLPKGIFPPDADRLHSTVGLLFISFDIFFFYIFLRHDCDKELLCVF